MIEKSNKASGGKSGPRRKGQDSEDTRQKGGFKSGARGKGNDFGDSRQKGGFKSGRPPRPSGKSNGKTGFKGASKVHRRR